MQMGEVIASKTIYVQENSLHNVTLPKAYDLDPTSLLTYQLRGEHRSRFRLYIGGAGVPLLSPVTVFDREGSKTTMVYSLQLVVSDTLSESKLCSSAGPK